MKKCNIQALEYIAKISDGGMRDALSILDKCLSYNDDLTVENTLQVLGSVNYDTMCDLLSAIGTENIKGCIEIVEKVYNSGLDLTQFMKQFWLFVLDVNKYALFKDFKYTQLPSTLESRLDVLTEYAVGNLLTDLLELNNNLKRETNVKQYVEATLFDWVD